MQVISMYLQLGFLIIKHLLVFIILLLSFCGMGKMIIKRLNIAFSSSFEEIFFTGTIGMLSFVIALIILGCLSFLYKPLVFILLAIGIIGVKDIKITIKDCLWFGIIFVVLSPLFYLTLYPPVTWDALSYHLPVAQSMLDNHKFVFNPYLCRYPLFPYNAEVLFAIGLSKGTSAVQLFPFTYMYFLSLGCFSEVSKRFNKPSGLFVIGLLISSPLIDYLATTCYIDILLALFITAAIIALCNYFENIENNKNWLYISAALLGFAVGTKYLALAFCIIIAFIFIYRKQPLTLLKYMVIVGIIGCFWYIRNFYYSGNPFWPFFAKIFGLGGIWSQADYIHQYRDINFQSFGKTFMNFLLIPILAAKTQELYGINLIIWPGLFITLFFVQKNRGMWILLYSLFAYTLYWFFFANVTRYFISIVPILCIISSVGIIHLINKYSEGLNRKLIFLIIFGYCFYCAVHYSNYKVNKDFASRPPVNNLEENKFLAKYISEYGAGKIALKQEGRTYGLLTDRLIFMGKGRIIGDWMGRASYFTVLDLLDRPDDLYKYLEKLNVKNLLISKKRVIFSTEVCPVPIIYPNTNFDFDYINSDFCVDRVNFIDYIRIKLGEKVKINNNRISDSNYTFDNTCYLIFYNDKLKLNNHFKKIYEDSDNVLYRLK